MCKGINSVDGAETSCRQGRVNNIQCEEVQTSEVKTVNAVEPQSNTLPWKPDARAEQCKALQAKMSKANGR